MAVRISPRDRPKPVHKYFLSLTPGGPRVWIFRRWAALGWGPTKRLRGGWLARRHPGGAIRRDARRLPRLGLAPGRRRPADRLPGPGVAARLGGAAGGGPADDRHRRRPRVRDGPRPTPAAPH